MAGRNSYGYDINPLAVLLSRVKSTPIDPILLSKESKKLSKCISPEIEGRRIGIAQDQTTLDEFVEENGPEHEYPTRPPTSFTNIDKWFSKEIREELDIVKYHINSIETTDEVRDFLRIGLAYVIRKVSRAYDGEVRPHFNPKKKQQQPFPLIKKKYKGMIERMTQFASILEPNTWAKAEMADSTHVPLEDESINLSIFHPPYLNSFNYATVLRLTLEYLDMDYIAARSRETKAHPATSVKVVESYFNYLEGTLKECRRIGMHGSILSVLIADCTVYKELLPVHRYILGIAQDVGFKAILIINRKPYYSTGAYSYNERVYDYERLLILKNV